MGVCVCVCRDVMFVFNTTGLPVDSPDHDNNTALHIAAANDHESIVAILLSHNANWEAKNNLGWTPLMQAARHGHMHVVLLFLQAGVSLDTRNRLGEETCTFCL